MKAVNRIRHLLLALTVGLFLASCGGSTKEKSANGEENEELDRRTEIRLKQYMVQGKKLYQTYCMNCHQGNGEGLAQLYPPLANSDYLLADLPRAAYLIKNGGMEEMTVNGKKYNQMMPGNPTLTPIEIAEIVTYVSNSWGNNEGLSSVKEVEKWLEACEKK